MAIELIAKIKQKNNGNFFLVDAADIEIEGQALTTYLENFSTNNNSIQTALEGINTKITAAEGKITTLESTVSGHTTTIGQLQTTIAGLPKINDTSATATSLYSSSKVEDLITTAKQAVKDDLLGGAGSAYDTLKELADLIQTNQSAIDALESIAAGHIRFDQAQSLTDEQKTQARGNIGALGSGDLTSINGSISTLQSDLSALKTSLGTIDTNYVAIFEAALQESA